MGPLIARLLGAVALLATGFLYLAAGLVVPVPYLPMMWVVWLGLVFVTIKKRADWRIVLASPFVSVGLWLAIISAGEKFLGWRG